MDITEFKGLCLKHKNVRLLTGLLSEGKERNILLRGLKASAASVVASSLVEGRNMLIVLDDNEEAGYFYNDLTQLCPGGCVDFFPSSYKRTIKYGIKDPSNEILRTEVLTHLQSAHGKTCIVTSSEALAELVVDKQALSDNTVVLRQGDKLDLSDLVKRLLAIGFKRVDYVYEPGQIALRGSLIDVFSFSNEFPYRIDFWDDEIDSIKTFDVVDQLSKDRLESVSLVPIFHRSNTTGMSFFDFLPSDTLLMFKGKMLICDKIAQMSTWTFSKQALLIEPELEGVKLSDLVISADTFSQMTNRFVQIEFGAALDKVTYDAALDFNVSPQPLFHKNFDLLANTLHGFISDGYRIYIASDSDKQIERIRSIFDDRGDNLHFEAVTRVLHEGFTDNDLKVCLFTDHQIFDRYHKYNLRSEKAKSGKIAQSLKELKAFQIGDFVVHADHGIGRFAGLVKIPNGDKMQEVMKIIYQNDDVVFVSIHSLHKVSKYKGKDGEPPHISKLGNGAWERLKEKTKTKIKDIARDLIKLYSKRKHEKGFAYSRDSFLQHELEASFIYEDTPDQNKATQDVKRDMERDIPMDRLVCGDVGFGKTEVAVRAAFKAVCDNKQVAVLVPTTVLAYQHYQTFKSRLRDFPCKVDYLTRARKASDVKRIQKELADGDIDILIGTHKIIGKSVKFNDLGLLIIDEEQKFGVSVKEKLRQLKSNVDTLTMTATPIPRTLQFSLMGARDLSVISTPPPNRYPIHTEIQLFDSDIIAEAINFEMGRSGQVFFVNNKISNLPELKSLIEKLVPGVRVCVGHGQMAPDQLEQTIMDFINFDYDVMLATSIIESGIDIPNVNTIIINQAQNFGLSDLHQLRGRVGRSNKKAFCYLLAPPLSVLSPEARRRLQAIENFSDLGSGINIAMQDLDIRGAGNLLGAEQSGFIAELGYETYQRILNEAVEELKTDEFSDLYSGESQSPVFAKETAIDCDFEAFFPTDYVPSSSERMLIYRELDKLATPEELEVFKTKLIDRFGPVPPEGEALIGIVRLRQIASGLGLEKVIVKGGVMSLYLDTDQSSKYYQSPLFDKLLNYVYRNPRRCELREKTGKNSIRIKDVNTVDEAIGILQSIMTSQTLNI